MTPTAIALWSSHNIGIFDLNYDTGEEYWSTHLRAMLGVPVDAAPGMHLLLQKVHPDDRRVLMRGMLNVWQPGCASSFAVEVRIVPHDGVVRRVHVEASTTFRDGDPHDAVRTVGLVVDVTERLADSSVTGSRSRPDELTEIPQRSALRGYARRAAAVTVAAALNFITAAVAAPGPTVTIGEPPAPQTATETAVARKALDEGQLRGRMDTFYDLFDVDFVDRTPLPGFSATREGVRHLYIALRSAFPDLRATSEFETGDGGNLVTVRRTFEATHTGAAFMKVPTTGRAVRFEAVDVLRVSGGKITERWGVIDLQGLLLQLRATPVAPRPTEIAQR